MAHPWLTNRIGPTPLTSSRSGRCPLRTTSRCPFSSRRSCEIGNIRSPHSRSRPVTASWLLPAATAPGTVFVHLLLAHPARPLCSLALVHPFFWRPRPRPSLVYFLTERMRLSLSLHPQLSVIPPPQTPMNPIRSHSSVFATNSPPR